MTRSGDIPKETFLRYAEQMDLNKNDVEGDTEDQAIAQQRFDDLGPNSGAEARRKAMGTLLDVGRKAHLEGNFQDASMAYGVILGQADSGRLASTARWNQALISEGEGDIARALELIAPLRANRGAPSTEVLVHAKVAQLALQRVEQLDQTNTWGHLSVRGTDPMEVRTERLDRLKQSVDAYAQVLRMLRTPERVTDTESVDVAAFQHEAAQGILTSITTYHATVDAMHGLAESQALLPWVSRMHASRGDEFLQRESVQNIIARAQHPMFPELAQQFAPLVTAADAAGIGSEGYQVLLALWAKSESDGASNSIPEDVVQDVRDHAPAMAWNFVESSANNAEVQLQATYMTAGIEPLAKVEPSIHRVQQALTQAGLR